jgi:hypothetical protein
VTICSFTAATTPLWNASYDALAGAKVAFLSFLGRLREGPPSRSAPSRVPGWSRARRYYTLRTLVIAALLVLLAALLAVLVWAITTAHRGLR